MEGISAKRLLPYFPDRIKKQLIRIESQIGLEEVHMRVHQPIQLVFGDKDILLYQEDPYEYPNTQELQELTARLCKQSLYAHLEELSQGFISLPGGYRVGITGRCVQQTGCGVLITEISSVNIRIPQSVSGQVGRILPYLCKDGKLCSTLILSPPGCGKTTFLRELIRLISTGTALCRGQRVGVADSRYELAGMSEGIPSFDLGPRTDVRSGGEKGDALLALLLAMSPEVLATDEIGRTQEAEAVISASLAGVAILATAHGNSISSLSRRPHLGRLLQDGLFERFVLLSRRDGPGTVEAVLDENDQELDWEAGVQR